MSDAFRNVYNDQTRADSYAKLEFPGTYYLAYRDLPEIITRHVARGAAFDFGCGTGRSTRLLSDLGFDPVLGVDISAAMLDQARERDARGRYQRVPDGDLSALPEACYDLVLSVFTFDNIPTREKKIALFTSLRGLLRPGGRLVNLVSAPEIYVNEWASFSTRDFPANKTARSGDTVQIVMLDVEDQRPVTDILWSDDAYREVYGQAGLNLLETRRPLANDAEPFAWVSETLIAPWTIYVLAP